MTDQNAMETKKPEGWLARARSSPVVTWTGAYIGASWLMLQAFNQLDANYGWPKELMRLVPILLAIGIPIVAVSAWLAQKRRPLRNLITGKALLGLALGGAAAGAAISIELDEPKGGFIPYRAASSPDGRSVTPVLRSWPYPLLDAMVLGAEGRRGRYAQSGAEHREGLTIQPGDLLVFSVYFRNDANVEKYDFDAAHDVRLVMSRDTSAQRERTASVDVVSDNTFVVHSGSVQTWGNLTLRAATPVRLAYVPASTQTCIKKGVTTGRATAKLNDLAGDCASTASSPAASRILPDGIIDSVAVIGAVPGMHTVTVVFGVRVFDAKDYVNPG